LCKSYRDEEDNLWFIEERPRKGVWIMVVCPECAAELDLDDGVVEGEILVCPDCGVELEVMSIDPISVDLAPEVEEDWGE
jgi:alpha-aminoadipate carrier protein LysW